MAKISKGNIGTKGYGGPENDSSDSDKYEPEESVSGPFKVIFRTTTAQTNLKIADVDFAGVHDQRSLTMMIPVIQPRNLILIRGTASDLALLPTNSSRS